MRMYKQLTAVSVIFRNMSIAGTEVSDAADNAASAFYVTAKTGVGNCFYEYCMEIESTRVIDCRRCDRCFSFWCMFRHSAECIAGCCSMVLRRVY